MSIIRYPGGKTKLAAKLVGTIRNHLDAAGVIAEYREPFFGGGGVGLRVLCDCPEFARAWLNDADPAMACLWRSIAREPASMRLILGCLEPSVAYFRLYKKLLRGIDRPEDLAPYDPTSVACMKVACHQLSYSGLGTMAGGPIGGESQASKYDVGCRYNPEGLGRGVAAANKLMAGVELRPEVCTCLDFEEILRAPGDAFVYLDPPYFKAGPGLYQVAFAHDDHVRLAHALRDETRPWLLSYDRHPVIEDLYGGWATIEEVPITYSINGSVKTSELLIGNLDPAVMAWA